MIEVQDVERAKREEAERQGYGTSTNEALVKMAETFNV